MKPIRFLHLSDCHYRSSYEGWYLADFHRRRPLDRGLRELVARVPAMEPAPSFLVVSGDLTHEGETEDYRALRDILDGTGLPILAVPGNHDRRDRFREGFLGVEASLEPIETVADFDGLRVVGLDSSVPGYETGEIGQDRVDRLAETLARPAERGTVVVVHHPPALKGGTVLERGFRGAERLLPALEGGEVLALLSGHTHRGKAGRFGSVPHVTAGSTAFGARAEGAWFSMNDDAEYADILLDGNGLSVRFERCAGPAEYARTELSRIEASMSGEKR